MVCSNQPTDGGRSPQAGRATLASHQARSGLGHAEGIPNAADRNVYRLQTSGQRLCAALDKIAVRDLPDALIQQFSRGHQEAINIARKALAHIEPEPDWTAQVDGNPKGGDAKQAPGDSLTARSRSDAPNP